MEHGSIIPKLTKLLTHPIIKTSTLQILERFVMSCVESELVVPASASKCSVSYIEKGPKILKFTSVSHHRNDYDG